MKPEAPSLDAQLQRLAELTHDWGNTGRHVRKIRTPEILDTVEDLTLNTTEVGVSLPDGRRVETGVSFEMPDPLWEDTTGADPRWIEPVRRDRQEYAALCREAGAKVPSR